MENKIFFYHDKVYNLNSPIVLVPYLIKKYNPSSVIDIGCGLGTWLKVLKDNGVSDILGVDGPWLNIDELHIDPNFILIKDLTESFSINKRFDLLLCLEVAEHLEENFAENFIRSLTKMSDTIIFSAAVPGQGGQNHINEQPPGYWLNIFEKQGFYLYEDFRDKFWDEPSIDWWYKQNMLVFKRKELGLDSNGIELKYKIHYELWERELQQKHNIWKKLMDTNQGKVSWRQLAKIVFRKITNYHKKVNRIS
jgi:SAM-dependent methyltransferase